MPVKENTKPEVTVEIPINDNSGLEIILTNVGQIEMYTCADRFDKFLYVYNKYFYRKNSRMRYFSSHLKSE